MGWQRRWDARWIWVGEAGPPPATVFQLDPLPRPADTVALFRRTLELTAAPPTAPARVTADGRYQLFVNGSLIGRGPVRGEPAHLKWDEYDLASHLVAGSNVVALLARNFGVSTMYYKVPQSAGQLGFGGLLFEAAVGDDLITSDGSWRTRLAPYQRARPGRWAGPPAVEIVDGRDWPADWAEPGFDDSGWAHAVELVPAGLGQADARPPQDPFSMLDAAPIGQLSERLVSPIRVVGAGETHPGPVHEHPLDDLDADGPGERRDEPISGPVPVHTGAWVTLDLGALTNSHPILEVDADPGTVVDLGVGEDLLDDGRAQLAPRRWALRYTAAGRAEESLEALEPVGFRYLTVAVRSGTVRSVGITARYRHYPRPQGATFTCDDESLEELWRVGAQTLDACSTDAFLDCPGREQRAWMGDAYVESLVSFVSNPDTDLVTWNAELLGQGVRADGLRPMVGGGDFSDSVATIPDFSLHWVRTLARIRDHLGGIDLIERTFPRVLDALQWFEWHRADDGLLRDLTGWVWVDWAQTGRDRNIAAADALYALALDDAAVLARSLEDTGTARRLHERAEQTRRAFDVFWDEERGVYVDSANPTDGRGRRVSQQTNVLAILSGAAPRERWGRMLDYVLDEDRLFMTRHPGDGGPADRRLFYQYEPAELFGGGRRMDEDSEVVLAQPFFCHFLHQALAMAGRRDAILTSIRRWRPLVERGDQVLQEYWTHLSGHGSRCHAWSATPTYDLSTHVLGVRRAAVGWTQVEVDPWFGPLTRLAGRVPTPHGLVEVELQRGEGGRVTLPAGVTGTYRFEGGTVDLPTGTTQVPA